MSMRNQDFEQYARTKAFNMSVADSWSATFHEIVQRVGRPPDEIALLDYGCGDGKYFPAFRGEGLSPANTHGIEVSNLRIERCRALGWTQAICLEKGARLPYPSSSFDIVNLMEVIEHIPSAAVDAVMEEIRRVIRPAGYLLGSTPNYPIKRFYDFYDAIVFRKWIRLRDDPTHVTFYSHDRVAKLLSPYFRSIELRCYKTGFLYRRLAQSPRLMHKILFVATGKAAR